MDRREELERRVQELEKEVSVLRGRSPMGIRGLRRQASWGIGNLPFYDVAFGPDLERGEFRGHAKGVIAIGDMATGFLAFGGLARGAVAIGGLAVGLLSFGGLSLGVLLAVGGLAIGGSALGGGAVGGVALGGGAAGYYACGGGAFGKHIVDATHRDPEANEFFSRYRISPLCKVR
jgi:hypothetical protein